MNGHSVVFGQLVQKLEQVTPNTTLQDDQNEWSQYRIWTAGSNVGIFLSFTLKSASAGQGQNGLCNIFTNTDIHVLYLRLYLYLCNVF